MEMRWNLDSLFKGFSDTAYSEYSDKLTAITNKIKIWADEDFFKDPKETCEKYISLFVEFGHIYGRMIQYSSLLLSVDTENKEAISQMEFLRKIDTETVSSYTKFRLFLAKTDNLDEIIDSSPLLKEHSFHLFEMKSISKYSLSPEIEEVVSEMRRTGSSAFTMLQNQITSSLSVDVNFGDKKETMPLAQARNLVYDPDKERRRAGYEGEMEAYKKIEISSSACLNAIKGEVLALSKRRGYSSPLEMTLIDNRMDEETLAALIGSIKDNLEHFRRYYKKKSKILGHSGALPFYDIMAPVGTLDIKFTYAEARDYIVDAFSSFSEDLSGFAKKVFDSGWIDAEPRKGKRGGAFCSNIHSIKESRILANFNGSFDNVSTLAHEIGHAYHGEQLRNESYLNADYPMPLAETASIFSETILMEHALSKMKKEDAYTLIENDIAGSGQVIVDIYSRYLFETRVFEERAVGALGHERLKQLMTESQVAAYGDGVDSSLLHPYMWANKPHYYYPNSNFYNFPYAFGLLFAKGLFAIYKKEGSSFVDKYKTVLKLTGRESIRNVGLSVGIDLSTKKFFNDSLGLIVEKIEEFVKNQ